MCTPFVRFFKYFMIQMDLSQWNERHRDRGWKRKKERDEEPFSFLHIAWKEEMKKEWQRFIHLLFYFAPYEIFTKQHRLFLLNIFSPFWCSFSSQQFLDNNSNTINWLWILHGFATKKTNKFLEKIQFFERESAICCISKEKSIFVFFTVLSLSLEALFL